MDTAKHRPLTLDDIADRLSLSRGRISQLRKTPGFPAPLRRALRRAEWDADEIAAWAEENGYAFRSDDAQERILRHWKESAPGRFTQVEAHALSGVSVLVYAENDTRVAVLFGRSSLNSSQFKSVMNKVESDWMAAVHSQLTLHSPLVRITDTATGESAAATLEDVARRLGVELPYLDYGPSEESLLLASRAGTTLKATPRPPRFYDLSAAYRVYASAEDDDIRALAAAVIEALQDGATDTLIQPLLEKSGNPAGEVLRMGVEARRPPTPPLGGDVDAGMEKALLSAPDDDDIIRLVAAMGGYGVAPYSEDIITHESPVTARLIRTTWTSEGKEGRTVPLTGHALLLGHLPASSRRVSELEFYANASGELGVIQGEHVAMTRRRVEGRRPGHVVFVEREGVMYLDEQGVAYAPTYHQRIGYGSGNASAASFVARELGVKDAPDANALSEALDTGTLVLDEPLPASEITDLVRSPR
ncbi:helix-turn-helix transcriptional regulator [Brachybacterium paraconglomeratum]|uniref:helix-turn-helix transcriptional regulator n=1 Tax=Brachybacterium paraconglomeratum TaxID=173362 RepID=UPI0022AE95E5|nr:hypothetical protein [Brachybacterium paraconglomeratum]MCZ4326776.1 hypothetical protein [Brachybacterium paraconglomeratum]